MTTHTGGRQLLRRSVDTTLVLLACLGALWALLMSALCIGSACSEGLRVTWWAAAALIAVPIGAALVARRATRVGGRVMLSVPLLIAIAASSG